MTTVIGRVHVPRCSKTPCVCGTCVCGQHRCPGIIQPIAFDGVTTYRATYTPKSTELQRPYAPSHQVLMTSSPLNHFLTTNEIYSVKGPVAERATLIRPQETLQRPSTPFVGTTTQRTDFPGYVASQRARSAQPKRTIEPLSHFASYETTNNAMQGPVAAAMRCGAHLRPTQQVQPATLATSSLPLEKNTTYREYFPVKRSVYERLSRARQAAIALPSALIDDRDFKTTKAIHFAPIKISPPCPAAAFSKRPASSDGHISMR